MPLDFATVYPLSTPTISYSPYRIAASSQPRITGNDDLLGSSEMVLLSRAQLFVSPVHYLAGRDRPSISVFPFFSIGAQRYRRALCPAMLAWFRC